MIRVFVVEDDPMVCHINKQFISKVSGFQVCGEARDVEDAKEGIQSLSPDIVLMDIYLPSGSGTELLKWMRKEEIESDVLFVTAEKNIGVVNEAFRYGAVDYLIKPFTFKRFAESLENIKERYKRINCSTEIGQGIIDEYILNYKVAPEKQTVDLAKGLNQNTYCQIFNYIKGNTGTVFTAEGVAEALGLARVTVRRYLEQMNREGKLELIQEYGRVGRPVHSYKYCKK